MENFEQKLERLEQISSQMRDPETPLQKSLQLFEEGMKLSKELEAELHSVEQKVELLTNSPDENQEPQFSPLEGSDNDEK
ncbi:MAG: exodeoxyribonuclease VII small subunit [Spirochaetota bacterium]